MILQQCDTCHIKGKNYYCNNCLKFPDFFDIYMYGNKNIKNDSNEGHRLVVRKAFTWHDAIEYVKNRFFSDLSKENININCEKDFAYIESDNSQYPSVDIKERQRKFVGYKIYLNKGLNASEEPSSAGENQTFSDLTDKSSE